MKIKKTDISSIFPTIIKNIKLSFDDVNKLLKLILSILYIVEFKVLVNVRMDNLNDFSKPILSKTRKLDKIKRLKKKEMNIKKDILILISNSGDTSELKNIIQFAKEMNKKLLSQIDDLKMPNLEKYLEPKYANVKSRGFLCDICNNYTANTKQSLAAHKRGCARKYAAANS